MAIVIICVLIKFFFFFVIGEIKTISWHLLTNLQFAELVAKSYEFVQSHLYIFLQYAYAPLTITL